MKSLHVGDAVRVVSPSSQWHDARGMVVQIIQRSSSMGPEVVQECEVRFGTDHRWFMAEQLVEIVPSSMIRFFRAQIIDRWQISADDAESLDGTRDQLIVMLCDRYEFTIRRAEKEVSEFLPEFLEKIRERSSAAVAPAVATEGTTPTP